LTKTEAVPAQSSGLCGPAGLPVPVVARLEREVAAESARWGDAACAADLQAE
jgi:hypothetical protein